MCKSQYCKRKTHAKQRTQLSIRVRLFCSLFELLAAVTRYFTLMLQPTISPLSAHASRYHCSFKLIIVVSLSLTSTAGSYNTTQASRQWSCRPPRPNTHTHLITALKLTCLVASKPVVPTCGVTSKPVVSTLVVDYSYLCSHCCSSSSDCYYMSI
jgi:hypothetical protein